MTLPTKTTRQKVLLISIGELGDYVAAAVADEWRLGLMTARRHERNEFALITMLLNPATGETRVCESPLRPGDRTFPSLTQRVPQAHWFERAIFDFFGLRPVGHPQFKNLILHEAWPVDFHPLADAAPSPPNGLSDSQHTGNVQPGAGGLPSSGKERRSYEFLEVKGEGIYEIPVGPIHAGIIEPGHFRFNCLGEVIQNLEIRLGYQHRGIEEQLARMPWRRARFLAEAASSDTSVGNALAHAMAIEQILGLAAPVHAHVLRAVALEIERAASHIGDLGGICGDIGYAGGAAIFARLRGRALGLGERLTGARFQTAYVVPGGVIRPLPDDLRDALLSETDGLSKEFSSAERLITDNSGVLERMEGIGRVRPSLARDYGLVGPAARACGIAYDVRRAFRQQPYDSLSWEVAAAGDGDVASRVAVRVQETRTSLEMIRQLLMSLPKDAEWRCVVPDELPANRVGVGVVESWRGELIHLIFTDGMGQISRYAIKDPSFNNWTGLAVAARTQLVSDFPLCNKSFSLSYSGNDL